MTSEQHQAQHGIDRLALIEQRSQAGPLDWADTEWLIRVADAAVKLLRSDTWRDSDLSLSNKPAIQRLRQAVDHD